jgi:transposase-like protein
MVQVNIKNLIDEVQCYQTVRELRWPDGITCSSCQSKQVIKRGFDDTEPARQRYECTDCHTRFDDLTDTIFAGHHQPLKVWILCLYFMGLNVSNEQIAQEVAVNGSDVQQMTTQLREGIVKKKPTVTLSNEVECDEAYVIAGHKGQPAVVKNKGRQGRRRRLQGKCGRGTFEFIPIKPLAATDSSAPGSCAGHSRVPSPDRGRPPSTGGSDLSQCGSA